MSILTVSAVLGLAVLDTLSPAVIGVTLYLILAAPRRLPVLLAVYLGTVAAGYFVLGVLLMLGLAAVVPTIDPTVRAWVQGGIGVALFVGSWFIPKKSSELPRISERAPTFPSMVLLGLGTWLFEFYTAVPFFTAIGIMTSARFAPTEWLPLLGAYVVIMILPGVALYLAWAILRQRVQERFERWQRRLATSSRTVLRWMVGIVGILIFFDALPIPISISIP